MTMNVGDIDFHVVLDSVPEGRDRRRNFARKYSLSSAFRILAERTPAQLPNTVTQQIIDELTRVFGSNLDQCLIPRPSDGSEKL